MNPIDESKQMPLPISEEERARRKAAIDTGRASVRLEGFILDEQAEALFARYVDGELDNSELNEAVLKLGASYGA
jgi:hypothetical protein